MIPLLTAVFGFARSPAGKYAVIGLCCAAALAYAYSRGADDAAAKCNAAALSAKIETLERDLDISRRAELRARDMQAASEQRVKMMNERLDAYESGLGTTPPSCLLSPADADRLRKLTR